MDLIQRKKSDFNQIRLRLLKFIVSAIINFHDFFSEIIYDGDKSKYVGKQCGKWECGKIDRWWYNDVRFISHWYAGKGNWISTVPFVFSDTQ